jgi:sugar O-acyltransferase (sialic acid O-acetyltransferase NeuD family)
MKRIVIIGAGNNGKCIADAVEKMGQYKIVGFLDTIRQAGDVFFSYPILGNQSEIASVVKVYNIHAGVISIGENHSRKKVVQEISHLLPDFEYVTVIHPQAVVSKEVNIGIGTTIMAGCIVNVNAKIGDFCLLNSGSILEHDSQMEDFSTLAPGVITGGYFHLGTLSTMGLGSKAIDRIRIGHNVVIGAGSLVIKDVEDNTLAYGHPANSIRKRKEDEPFLS